MIFEPGVFLYALLLLCSLVLQGFFTMMEMASVSYNKIRLRYDVSRKKTSALILSSMLKKPIYLFGVTLLGLNTVLQFGSECSRQLYLKMELNPNFAPITQVVLVLIFAEIIPLFAGRKYPERVVAIGAPILYCFSILFRPIIWCLDFFSRFLYWIFGITNRGVFLISRDELLKVIEEREESEEKNTMIVAIENIMMMKKLRAKDLMTPLSHLHTLSSSSTVGRVRELMRGAYKPFIAVYHLHKDNILAILNTRDILRLEDKARIEAHWKIPWFVSESALLIDLLKQFRKKDERAAVVVSRDGKEIGVITLDQILDEIVGAKNKEDLLKKTKQIIARSFPASKTILSLNREYSLCLEVPAHVETLEDLMKDNESTEESVFFGGYLFTQVAKKRIKIESI